MSIVLCLNEGMLVDQVGFLLMCFISQMAGG